MAFAAVLKVAKDGLQVRCGKHVPSEAPKIRKRTSDGSCDSLAERMWVGNTLNSRRKVLQSLSARIIAYSSLRYFSNVALLH